MVSDFVYFSGRAQEEREAAMRAAHPSARRAHLELATRYEDLASAIADKPPVQAVPIASA